MDTIKGILHDVRNEVGVVMGFTNLLIDTIDHNEHCRKALEIDPFFADMPKKARDRLGLCINRLTLLEEQSVKSENCGMDKLKVANQESLVRELSTRFDIKVSFDFSNAQNEHFYCNEINWKRTIYNIVENTHRAGASKVYIEVNHTYHTVKWTFKDNGHGMNETQIQELGFGYSGNSQGTGIGTQIILDMVAKAGGYVRWSSIPKLGTACEIILRRVHAE